MEKRIFRLEIAVLILFVLIAFNIAITVYIGVTSRRENIQGEDAASKQKELPKGIDAEEKARLATEFQISYNNNDTKAMYNMLSDFSKIYTKQEDVENGMGAMKKYFGQINEVNFSHSEYIGYNRGADWHNLIYKAETDSAFVDLIIFLRIADGKWELAAYRFSFDKNYSSKPFDW